MGEERALDISSRRTDATPRRPADQSGAISCGNLAARRELVLRDKCVERYRTPVLGSAETGGASGAGSALGGSKLEAMMAKRIGHRPA